MGGARGREQFGVSYVVNSIGSGRLCGKDSRQKIKFWQIHRKDRIEYGPGPYPKTYLPPRWPTPPVPYHNIQFFPICTINIKNKDLESCNWAERI